MKIIGKIAIVALAAMVIYCYAAILWDIHRNKIIVSSESAGIAQTAQFLPAGFFDHNRTQITTNKGIFLANGSFELIKGDELLIEKRASGRRYLCDHKNDTCKKLD